jgi:hypothetical protein
MKKLILTIPVILLGILAAAIFTKPSVTQETVEVEIPLHSLKQPSAQPE